MFGTLVIFAVLFPISLLISHIRRNTPAARRQQRIDEARVFRGRAPMVTVYPARVPAPRARQALPWGQIAAGAAGAWAVHEMFADHRRSEYIGQQIDHAQFHALGDEPFGSPEYYRDEQEYLHHRF